MARRAGWLRWPVRLLVPALMAGATVALAPLALSGAPAPDAQAHGAKAEAPKTDKTDKTDKKDEAKAPSVATVGPSGKIERKGEKPAEKTDGKGEAKTDGKGEANREVKADAKTEAKTETKTETKRPERAGGVKAARGPADEPAPPLTPPIKMSGLRDEMSRPPRKEEHGSNTRGERERLEQLATEINKAREGLRQETARLEALLAARDAAAQAAPSQSAAGDGGDPPKKTPTTLDSLAKAIRGMKPEQAAPIISRVDRKLGADVLLRMPGADAGKVMGVCKPEVAAELAAEIASRTPRAELRR